MLSTARDMLRWHRALEGDNVLDQRPKHELFKPRVLEEPGVRRLLLRVRVVILDTDDGTVAWHNGGNGWSYGELARRLDERVMVFLVTNRDKAEGGTSPDWAQSSPEGSPSACVTALTGRGTRGR
jgi:hypothetical protein